MGRDLNSRSPVCETGILTKLDHPSNGRAKIYPNQIGNKYLSIDSASISLVDLSKLSAKQNYTTRQHSAFRFQVP